MLKPVLKWAGGKTAILSQIEERIKKIDISSDATFYDIFAGGASVSIRFSDRFKRIVINDKNTELINVYKVIQKDPKKLINLLKSHESKHNHDYYYEVRKADRESSYMNSDSAVKAARMIYLNKTCYNGLFRVNSNGFFNVPIGRQKKISIFNEENIFELNQMFSKVEILNKDFSVILQSCKPGDVVYIDPPYDKITQNSFIQYNAIPFDIFDQDRLVEEIDELTKRGVYVIASNSYTPNTEKLYERYIKKDSIIEVRRSIASNNISRQPIKEILIDNIDEVNRNVNKNNKTRQDDCISTSK